MDQLALAVVCAWLFTSFALIGRSVSRGRRLSDDLAHRHPHLYEELGRPRPSWLQSVRRSRFERFVQGREYAALDDPVLKEAFETYRAAELRLLVFLIGSTCIVAGVVYLARWLAEGAPPGGLG